jgi:hypothetical protein
MTTWPLYWLRAPGCPLNPFRVKAGAGPVASPLAANAVDAMTIAAMVQRLSSFIVELSLDLEFRMICPPDQ